MWGIIKSLVVCRCLWTQEHHVRNHSISCGALWRGLWTQEHHVMNHSIPCGVKRRVNPGTSCEKSFNPCGGKRLFKLGTSCDESFNPLWCEEAFEPRNIMWGIIQSLVVLRCLWTQEHHVRNHLIPCGVKMLVNPGTSCEESFNPLWCEEACEPRNIMWGIIQSLVMWRCLWTQEHHVRNHSIPCGVKMLVNPGTSCEESFNPLWCEDACEPRNIMWGIIQSLVMWRCLWTQEHHVRNHSIPCGVKRLVNPGTLCEEYFNPLWCEEAGEPRNIMWGLIQSLVVWRGVWTQEHHVRNHLIPVVGRGFLN